MACCAECITVQNLQQIQIKDAADAWLKELRAKVRAGSDPSRCLSKNGDGPNTKL
jgi:hypothetical protein